VTEKYTHTEILFFLRCLEFLRHFFRFTWVEPLLPSELP